MDIKAFMKINDEKPLDNLVINGGLCGIFRKIVCVGDSLSSGELESLMNGEKGYHDYYEYSWGQYLARDAGCTVYNFSKGGMNVTNYCEYYGSANNYWSTEFRAQAYIIALGVNDVSDIIKGELEFGNISDIDMSNYENNKSTFIGNYSKIIQRYRKISPKAKFFLMTMPKETDITNEREELYNKHSEFLYKLAEIFDNTYIIDLRKYAPVYDEEFKKNFYLGTHMAPAGYRITALMVESYIDYIIRHNMPYFKQVGFLGTDFYNEEEIY